jgi:hypothetical protein
MRGKRKEVKKMKRNEASSMDAYIDYIKTGRFVSKAIAQKQEEVKRKEAEVAAINAEIEQLMAAEIERPEWLLELVGRIAGDFGVTTGVFWNRVEENRHKNIDTIIDGDEGFF